MAFTAADCSKKDSLPDFETAGKARVLAAGALALGRDAAGGLPNA